MVKDIDTFLRTITKLLKHVKAEYKEELKIEKNLTSLIEEIEVQFDQYTLRKDNLEKLQESIERILKYSHAIAPAVTQHDQTLKSLKTTLIEEFPNLKERL